MRSRRFRGGQIHAGQLVRRENIGKKKYQKKREQAWKEKGGDGDEASSDTGVRPGFVLGVKNTK